MIWDIVVSLLAGFFGALGIGGGAILLLYLTFFINMNQLQAQGINLLFFLPCALTGLIFHIKHRLVNFKIAIPLLLFGCIGVTIGFFISSRLPDELLKKIFGVFVLVIAFKQIAAAAKEIQTKKEKRS